MNEHPNALRLAEHLAVDAMHLRCELVALPGEADEFEHRENRGRCRGSAVAVKWEDGFADSVCAKHAESAARRATALLVLPKRHDGTDPYSRRNESTAAGV